MSKTQRTAKVSWKGDLLKGTGAIDTGSGLFQQTPVSWPARVERPNGKTSPEELLAAAHASCYAMALSHTLSQAGFTPNELQVEATVTLNDKQGGGKQITSSELRVVGDVPGVSAEQFRDLARQGEAGCPVSNALRNNVHIKLESSLK